MSHSVLFLLHLSTICACNLLILPRDKSDDQLYSVAATVANQHFDRRLNTILYSHGSVASNVNYFIQKYKGCILNQLIRDISSNQMNFPMQVQYYIKQYVIGMKHLSELDGILNELKAQRSFDNTGKFIIICKRQKNLGPACDAKLVFDICWKYRIADVALLYCDENRKITVATYYPQSAGECHNTEPVILKATSPFEEYIKSVNVFPKKFHNFNRCPMIVSTFHSPPTVTIKTDARTGITLGGLIGPLAHMLTEILNATLRVVTPIGVQTSGKLNGTVWIGSLGDLSRKRANVSVSYAFVTAQRMSAFRMAYPRRMITFVWVSPPSRVRPAWEKLMRPFDLQLRLSLSLLVFFTFTSMVMIRQTKLKYLWNSHFLQDPVTDGVYLHTCAIFLGQVSEHRPKKMVLSFVLALWLWFTFFMRNAYQGALVGALKHDAYEPHFNTLRDAAGAGYEFGGPQEMIDILAEEPDLQKLYKNLDSKKVSHYFDRMANGSLNCVLLRALWQVYEFNLMAKKTERLNVLPQLAIVIPNGNYLSSDSPLVDAIDEAYARILAGGFDNKLTADYDFAKALSHRKLRMHTNIEDRLTMHNMKVCFALLLSGYVASAVMFATECSWHKYIKPNLS